MDIITVALERTQNVKLVVVDGIVDLMDDFMDAKEGQNTVSNLTSLSSQFDVHVAGVLHQNKGQSKDARAHVGSISSQKCEIEVMAEVDPNDRHQSIITCKESRGIPFNSFAIRWDKDSLPVIVQNFVPGIAKVKKGTKYKHPNEIEDGIHIGIINKLLGSGIKPPQYKKLIDCLTIEFNKYYGFDVSNYQIRLLHQYHISKGFIFRIMKKPYPVYSHIKPDDYEG